MLCAACEGIFKEKYLLGSAKKLRWQQTHQSFNDGRQKGCQICNFIWSQLSSGSLVTSELTEKHFPCQYAFELHNADWARFGREPEYLEIAAAGDETEEYAEDRAGKALSRYGSDYNIHKLRYLLRKECQKLLSGEYEMWAVLTFDLGGPPLRLPLQVHRGVFISTSADLLLSILTLIRRGT